jgi:NAD(P)-dependent dehydrogenase (short-subunit alcohol dehydrogenase family)
MMSGECVAVVTGGGSGIGEAAARRLAKAGYRLAVLDIDVAHGKAVAASIGAPAIFVKVDVADATSVIAAADSVAAVFGRVDALVNSAGILQNATRVLDMKLDEADRILRVNYLGTVACCQAFGQMMKAAGRGSIINLASISSFRCSAQPAYGATKAAVVSLTETLAAELGPWGVRVNAVAPGYTLTPALQARIDSGQRDP